MVDLKKKTPFVWFNMARDEGQPLVARLATSWPKKIALLAQKLVRLTCGKSNNMVKNPNW